MIYKGNLPVFDTVTEARDHEVNEVCRVEFPNGSIVTIDRGYTDYEWHKSMTVRGIFFVARLQTKRQSAL